VLAFPRLRCSALEIATYHFLFWNFLPLIGAGASPRRGAGYLLATVAATGFFLALSPIGPAPLRLPTGLYVQAFSFFSFAHITLSLALSRANPSALVHWFLDSAHALRPRAVLESGESR
jgi:hypothetical protein